MERATPAPASARDGNPAAGSGRRAQAQGTGAGHRRRAQAQGAGAGGGEKGGRAPARTLSAELRTKRNVAEWKICLD